MQFGSLDPITVEYKYSWKMLNPSGAGLQYESLETVSYAKDSAQGLHITFHPVKNQVFVNTKTWDSFCCYRNMVRLTESLYPVELYLPKNGPFQLMNYEPVHKRWQEQCDHVLASNCCDHIKRYIEVRSKQSWLERLMYKHFTQFFFIDTSSSCHFFRLYNFPALSFSVDTRLDLLARQNNINIYGVDHPGCEENNFSPIKGELNFSALENGLPSWASFSHSITIEKYGCFTKKIDLALITAPAKAKDSSQMN